MKKHSGKNSSENYNYLLQELKIHQLELEMQNEELNRINSELEHTLDKYTGLYNFAPVGFFTINEKGLIQKNNPTGAMLLGHTGHSLINSKFRDFVEKSSLITFDTFICNVLKSATKQNSEMVMVNTDGKKIFTYIDGVAIQSEEGDGREILLAITDITDCRAIENELAEARILDKLKIEFFSNISHELRTPLNVILASIQLIELYKKTVSIDKRAVEMDRNYSIIKQNCYRLLRMVNNLIDSTRIDSGSCEMHLQNKDIVSIVKNIVLLAMKFAENKDIILEFASDVKDKEMPIDQELFEKVILNLLSNAVKFTKPGGRILVKIFEENGKFAISFKDNGIGIPKDKLEAVFQRFRQVDKGLTRGHEGMGIGLSLAKSIVELHGGTIFVKSVFGEGCEFIIMLPLKVLAPDNVKTAEKLEDNKECYAEKLEDKKDYYTEKINIEFSDIYF